MLPYGIPNYYDIITWLILLLIASIIMNFIDKIFIGISEMMKKYNIKKYENKNKRKQFLKKFKSKK
jgi:hypothetical protein